MMWNRYSCDHGIGVLLVSKKSPKIHHQACIFIQMDSVTCDDQLITHLIGQSIDNERNCWLCVAPE